MKFYIVENSKPAGPFEIEELIARGIKGSDLVWTEGLTEWVPAETVVEIRDAMYSGRTNSCYNPETPPVPPMQQPHPMNPNMPPYIPQQPAYQQQGQYNQQASQPPCNPYSYDIPPKSWLLESILVTVFCCIPFGIVGIIKASSVSSLWAAGHREEAFKASGDAKNGH